MTHNAGFLPWLRESRHPWGSHMAFSLASHTTQAIPSPQQGFSFPSRSQEERRDQRIGRGVGRPHLRPSSALGSLSLSPSLGFLSINSGVEGRELRTRVYRQGTPFPVRFSWAAHQWQLCPPVALEGEGPFSRSLTCSPCGVPEAHQSTLWLAGP